MSRFCGVLAWFFAVLLAGAAAGQQGGAGPAEAPVSGAQVPYGQRLTAARRGVALQVNDGAVTSTDVIGPVREQLLELAGRLDREAFLAQARSILARSTADEVRSLLLYQYAYREMESNDQFEMALEAQLDKRKLSLLAEHDGSEARAQAALAARGTTVEDELEDSRRRFVVSAYQELNFLPTLDITRSQLLQHYQTRLREDYTTKASLQFQLIDVQIRKFLPEGVSSPSAGQLSAAREAAGSAAREALAKLRGGADFSAVVAEYSHGYRRSYEGVWRPVEPSALAAKYQPVARGLEGVEVGGITGVIEGEESFFIARLLERVEAGARPFAEVQDEIEAALQSERWRAFSGRLASELFDKAILGDLEGFVDETAAVAWEQLAGGAGQGAQ